MFIRKKNARFIHALTVIFLFVLVFLVHTPLKGEDNKKNGANNDYKLFEDFIRSKGYSNTIVLDASNVKRFWIDKSVFSRDAGIGVVLDKSAAYGWAGVPLPIQLANVRADLDCRIDIISKDQDLNFSVLNKKMDSIQCSSSNEMFIDYKITSKSFHLEDTTSSLFYLSFNSQRFSTLSIKKIILSFSMNKKSNFLYGPGSLTITKEDLVADKTTINGNDKIIFVSGKHDNNILAREKIVVNDTPLTYSVKIKNTGKNAVYTFCGFATYTKEMELVDSRCVPYKNNANKILKILSSNDRSNIFVVDSYPDWEKGCVLALNAKEDLSDFPNTHYLGYIADVRKLDNDQAEIFLSWRLKDGIEKGTPVRVQEKHRYRYLSFQTKKIEPGEETAIASTISKDNNFLSFSSKVLCRGVYCATPVIVVCSIKPNAEYTIEISDYIITY